MGWETRKRQKENIAYIVYVKRLLILRAVKKQLYCLAPLLRWQLVRNLQKATKRKGM